MYLCHSNRNLTMSFNSIVFTLTEREKKNAIELMRALSKNDKHPTPENYAELRVAFLKCNKNSRNLVEEAIRQAEIQHPIKLNEMEAC